MLPCVKRKNAPLLQVCAFTGIWGVSFLLWFVNAALACAVLFPQPRKAALASLLAAPALALFAWGWGAWHLHSLTENSQMIVAAAIQDFSGADAHDFAPEANLSGDIPDSETLTRRAAAQGAQLIVGTENAWGAAFSPSSSNAIPAQLARENRRVFWWSAIRTTPSRCRLTAPRLSGRNGKTVGVHHKLRLFLGERQAMQPGQEIEAWNTPLGKVGQLICFDTCYTGDVRKCVQAGAQIIAVPNYDPPTPGNALHNLHAALLPFRAVENGVAIVRADPNGRSQIIDGQDRTVADSPMFRAAALVAPVVLGDGRGTFFTQFGDWFAYGCGLGTMIFVCLYPKKAGADAPAS